jgi:hypothetical protein
VLRELDVHLASLAADTCFMDSGPATLVAN